MPARANHSSTTRRVLPPASYSTTGSVASTAGVTTSGRRPARLPPSPYPSGSPPGFAGPAVRAARGGGAVGAA